MVQSREEAAAYWKESHGARARAKALGALLLRPLTPGWIASGVIAAGGIAAASVTLLLLSEPGGSSEAHPTAIAAVADSTSRARLLADASTTFVRQNHPPVALRGLSSSEVGRWAGCIS